jgi:hypothetical protein
MICACNSHIFCVGEFEGKLETGRRNLIFGPLEFIVNVTFVTEVLSVAEITLCTYIYICVCV